MKERTNEEWLAALRGPRNEEALADLRAALVRGLKVTFAGRMRGLDESAEDFAQEALIRILDNLDSFRGDSRFTTWAQKVAVRVALTELRRKRWRDVSLQEMVARYEESGREVAALADPSSPEKQVARKMMVERLQRFMVEDLTDRQRQAMVVVMFQGMPGGEAARRMETTRGALYKMLHDARKKLKRRMEAEGLSSREVLDSLGEG